MAAGRVPETDHYKIAFYIMQGSRSVERINQVKWGCRLPNQVSHHAVSPFEGKIFILLGKEVGLAGIDVFFKQVNKYSVLAHVFRIYVFLYKMHHQEFKHLGAAS